VQELLALDSKIEVDDATGRMSRRTDDGVVCVERRRA
jgi:hypothetical protein